MSEPIFPIVVDRLLRVRSGTESDELSFPLDPDGFLDPAARSAAYSDFLLPGALVRPDIAVRAGALVLLGEPGIGKSTVFKSLTGQTDTQQANIHWIDAANVTDSTFDEELGDLFRNLPSRFSDSSGSQLAGRESEGVRHTIIIDQLDESPIVRRLPRKLRSVLTGKDASSMRLLIACRTADYPTELTDVLASVFGKCVLGDLAPLTREQVMELVASAGVDQVAFAEAAATAGAGPLASVPLTLGLLVRSYKQDEKLEESRKILFGKCVLQLLDEHEPNRLSDHSTSSHQRLAMASRMAAYLLLCGRRTLWLGRALDAGPQDLHAGLLADGSETTATGSFQVTPSGIMATLSTALYTGRGHSRLAFRHSSIAAYLAASYIAQHNPPTRQLENLFLVAGGKGAQSIPELLRETAAWLVNIDPAHAEWLVNADPQSLVGHSRVVDSNAVRALIVESLLRRADEVELSHVFSGRARWQLDHPGIGEQLNRILLEEGDIEPTDWPALSRVRLAVRLAREAGTSELTEPLLNLAESDNWSAHMRQLAALTAFETEPQLAAPRLLGVLSRLRDVAYAQDKDPDDELRGSLLDMLWPEHMQTSDVLHYLTRQRSHELFGLLPSFQDAFP